MPRPVLNWSNQFARPKNLNMHYSTLNGSTEMLYPYSHGVHFGKLKHRQAYQLTGDLLTYLRVKVQSGAFCFFEPYTGRHFRDKSYIVFHYLECPKDAKKSYPFLGCNKVG